MDEVDKPRTIKVLKTAGARTFESPVPPMSLLLRKHTLRKPAEGVLKATWLLRLKMSWNPAGPAAQSIFSTYRIAVLNRMLNLPGEFALASQTGPETLPLAERTLSLHGYYPISAKHPIHLTRYRQEKPLLLGKI